MYQWAKKQIKQTIGFIDEAVKEYERLLENKVKDNRVPVNVIYDIEKDLYEFNFQTGNATPIFSVIIPKIKELCKGRIYADSDKPWITFIDIEEEDLEEIVKNHNLRVQDFKGKTKKETTFRSDPLTPSNNFEYLDNIAKKYGHL